MAVIRCSPTVAMLLALTLSVTTATIPSSFLQVSIPFNTSFRNASNDLSLDNPLVRSPTLPSQTLAQQQHVTYINETAVMVTWISGNGVLFNGTAVPANAANVTTSLRLTPASNSVQVTPFRNSSYTYMFDNIPATANQPSAINYLSGVVNTVLLMGLQPGKTYSYAIVDGSGAVMRNNLDFTMPPAVGEPMRYLVIGMCDVPECFHDGHMMATGDLGQTHNSTDTLKRAQEEHDVDMVMLVGDLSYANHYYPNGTTLVLPGSPAKPNPAIPGDNSYQPRWDSWVRQTCCWCVVRWHSLLCHCRAA